jgi:hypothetical protein
VLALRWSGVELDGARPILRVVGTLQRRRHRAGGPAPQGCPIGADPPWPPVRSRSCSSSAWSRWSAGS